MVIMVLDMILISAAILRGHLAIRCPSFGVAVFVSVGAAVLWAEIGKENTSKFTKHFRMFPFNTRYPLVN